MLRRGDTGGQQFICPATGFVHAQHRWIGGLVPGLIRASGLADLSRLAFHIKNIVANLESQSDVVDVALKVMNYSDLKS